jgi:hypothetical protein
MEMKEVVKPTITTNAHGPSYFSLSNKSVAMVCKADYCLIVQRWKAKKRLRRTLLYTRFPNIGI